MDKSVNQSSIRKKIKLLFIVNFEYCSPRIPGLLKYLNYDLFEAYVVCPPIPKGAAFGPNVELLKNKNIRLIEVGERAEPRIDNNSHLSAIKRFASKNKRIYKFFSYLYAQYSSFKHYPDKDIGWKDSAVDKIKYLVDVCGIDFNLIISSSSPVTMHIIASEIKQKYTVPWLADFRDPWTQNHSYSFNFVRKYFESKLEKKTMGRVDGIITTAHLARELLAHKYNKYALNITNGYDPEFYPPSKNLTHNGKLTIRYIGNIYFNNQNPELLFSALKELIDEGTICSKLVRVEFYGPTLHWLKELIKKYGLEKVVSQNGMITREHAYNKQLTSDILLLFNWETKLSVPPYPIKLFEYFGAKKNILATGGKLSDPLKQILERTCAGEFCPTKNEIKQYVVSKYSEFHNKKKSHLDYRGITKELNKYSYLSTTKEFEKLFILFAKQKSNGMD